MDLSRTAVAIRPRAPWEAVDLGIRMARHWWWLLVRVWLILSLPPFLLLLLVPADYLWLPPVIIWWTKPLWERPLLFILSQALFGYTPSIRETLRAFPGVVRPQLLAWLTWRRLSPFRSMDMPVTQLEGLNGAARTERIHLLRRQDAQPAAWLTIIGIHVEGFLAFAMIILVWMFVPETVDLSTPQEILANQSAWFIRLQNFVGYCIAAAVAPFYVATGFALYLNRRIRLEGWDIEVAFRQMVQKRIAQSEPPFDKNNPAPPGATHSVSALVFACVLILTATFDVMPVAAAEQAPTREHVAQQVDEILSGDDFHRTETQERIVWGDDEEKEDFNWNLSLPEGWGEFFKIVAMNLELVFWVVVILLIFWVVVRYRHWLEQFAGVSSSRKPVARPETLFGLDVRRESLPEDVPAAVKALWPSDPRAAVSLLYRAWLVRLIDKGVEIEPGYTEADCLHEVAREAPAEVTASFGAVTRVWQKLAYAHQPAGTVDIDDLCRDWSEQWNPEELNA